MWRGALMRDWRRVASATTQKRFTSSLHNPPGPQSPCGFGNDKIEVQPWPLSIEEWVESERLDPACRIPGQPKVSMVSPKGEKWESFITKHTIREFEQKLDSNYALIHLYGGNQKEMTTVVELLEENDYYYPTLKSLEVVISDDNYTSVSLLKSIERCYRLNRLKIHVIHPMYAEHVSRILGHLAPIDGDLELVCDQPTAETLLKLRVDPFATFRAKRVIVCAPVGHPACHFPSEMICALENIIGARPMIRTDPGNATRLFVEDGGRYSGSWRQSKFGSDFWTVVQQDGSGPFNWQGI